MMKSLFVLALLVPFVVGQVDVLSPLADLSAPANNYELIEKINSANGKWWARANWPEDWTLADVRGMLGGFINPEDVSGEYEAPEGYTAPDAFSWTEAMPECVDDIRDQGRCGSCWAFAEVQVFQDRFCIASGGERKPVLAPQDPVSCDKANMGCRGGRLSSWKYMEKTGVVEEECMPYTSGGGDRGKCPKACTGTGNFDKFKVVKKSSKSMNGEKSMKEAISKDGPIEVAFKVYEDFIAYGGGVYEHTTGKFLGGHAVRAVGYGEDNGTPYWLIANSWSSAWGEDGYFRFIRGKNDCGLEKQTVAGLPDLSSP